MGTAESRAAVADDVPLTAPEPEPEQAAPTLPPPPLQALPTELLIELTHWLGLTELSAIASACKELAANVPDTAWQPHLARLMQAGNAVAENVELADRRITNSVQRAAAIQAASEAAEAEAFSLALTVVFDSTSSCRRRVASLRSLVCNLCQVVPASALYFPCIERGVCRACVRTRPDVADAWRYHQARFEQAAVAHRDALVCSQLHELVGPSLPWSLRDVAPRLIFSSETNGGSLATMLRCAQGSQASALVITMLEEEEELRPDEEGAEGSRQLGRQEGSPADKPAATRRTILSPLALRDIDRQSRRALGMRQRLFGAFCPVPWPRTPNERRTSFFGDETTLLFSLKPRAKLYPATDGSPGNFFRCAGAPTLTPTLTEP